MTVLILAVSEDVIVVPGFCGDFVLQDAAIEEK
jgi:hypothetical protein